MPSWLRQLVTRGVSSGLFAQLVQHAFYYALAKDANARVEYNQSSRAGYYPFTGWGPVFF